MRRTRIPVRPFAALALVGGVVAVANGPAPVGARTDHDCGDFATQAQAQRYFDGQGYGATSDPERLDANHDGRACESRPCPCAEPASTPAPGSAPSATGTPRSTTATVRRAVDGDTIQVRLRDGRRRTVRVLGIDAPESSTTRYGKADCGGRAAGALLRRLLPRGATVTLVSDPSQDRSDRYGRLLAYVEQGGEDAGREVVRRGWAEPYVYGRPFVRVASYRAAARAARRERLGVWASCDGDFHTAVP